MALYDPPLRIADVRAWSATKTGPYTYADARNCALCQYLNETGRTREAQVGSSSWSDGDGPRSFLDPALIAALATLPHTFEALTERLS